LASPSSAFGWGSVGCRRRRSPAWMCFGKPEQQQQPTKSPQSIEHNKRITEHIRPVLCDGERGERERERVCVRESTQHTIHKTTPTAMNPSKNALIQKLRGSGQ
jgi:hypothetical protein